MEIIDGNEIASSVLRGLTDRISTFGEKKPCVTFIRVGDDPASISYLRKKEKTANEVGILSQLKVFPVEMSQEDLLGEIDKLNSDPEVHGILVQAPLPEHMDERTVFNRVHPSKDVDGFNATNLGKLCQEQEDAFISCTPAGIVEIIKRTGIETDGKHVVVLGRSLIVGKPAGMLFLRKGFPGNATVTFCHSRTANLKDFVKRADLIIAAIGKPLFVQADMVKEGAVIIDVGINRISDETKKSGYRLVGDVDFEKVAPKTSYITPVPGGVGPMTVAMLMSNTVKAFEQARK
ncbi:MAG: bifunctional 5,10-methylene-tetrahydrofolate dehydrogenase/5,10-methylene-tetrahydrofolate cyclohydrolase [Opitutae bacterium]|jgi:methylenetetrahydrofolate dehydrogenase (NADP+)/methenyltetrahydrofolate cyclohydrolase|nr:bifunctional 5,10-methylene-tetrahydrofolate dehydrogenase/5,10-methylene-tetrahydrofolate cyclohydrolase [Opitutae bacterium]MEC7543739.1 bifunctional 5,10-methylenetetrahydrofolate dehydrogenase/5,10-methenyltetrahydrofolate cyclohydrolase [Verrucomicrobiota bacterium]MED5279931.1 bifunctional 5,10-methylenetetrahydrofolate dehydrogenase/5,10-methenyltetrahydrofolate cyclohydrolase [Verrucomicrobiota bacterium]HAY74589.1 bifunctional 5,10-methylene-tetrahydrofolate dehydrogenase/5,10-methyl|tara:strand:- start:3387 stop:4259 length:873 start_codon:yes stop_codon:yes gene_type:complete